MDPFSVPAPDTIRLLIAEDEDSFREALRDFLSAPLRSIQGFASGEEAIQALRQSPFDLVITDLRLLGADGLRVLAEAKRSNPEAVVIIITGYASLDTAIQAIRGGAYDYLRKPFQVEELEMVVHNACERILRRRQKSLWVQELRGNREEPDRTGNPAEGCLPEKGVGPGSTPAGGGLGPRPVPSGPHGGPAEERQPWLGDLERLMALRRQGFLEEGEFVRLKRILLRRAK